MQRHRRARPGAHRLVPREVETLAAGSGRHRLVEEASPRARPWSLVVLAVGTTAMGLGFAWFGTDLGDPTSTMTSRAFDEPPAAPDRVPASPDASPLAGASDPTSPATGREARPSRERPRAEPATRIGRAAQRVPEAADGTFTTVPVDGPTDTGATTYVVQTEDGLPLRPKSFGSAVASTLGDPRSWAEGDRSVLSLASDLDSADFRVVLASPETTDALCAPLLTRGRVSCRNGGDVVINAWRWVNGAEGYGDDLTSYRQYVVNHEVGHALGHGHVGCPAPGEPAPVMLQQTLGLQGCAPNPWPAITDLRGH